MPSLNIKDERITEMIAQLAEEKGISKTAAVGAAVESALRRERKRKHAEEFLERLRHRKNNPPPGIDSTNASDFLYDDDGLPK